MINWETVLSVIMAMLIYQVLIIIGCGLKPRGLANIPATGPWRSVDDPPPLRKDVLLRVGDTYRVGWRDDYYRYSATGIGSFSAEKVTAWAALNTQDDDAIKEEQ